MTIERMDEEVTLPFDVDAILSEDHRQLAGYLRRLVNEIERVRLHDLHQRVNLLLDIAPGDAWYSNPKDSTGDYPNGTWRIRKNGSDELSREKKVAGSWTVVLVDDV